MGCGTISREEYSAIAEVNSPQRLHVRLLRSNMMMICRRFTARLSLSLRSDDDIVHMEQPLGIAIGSILGDGNLKQLSKRRLASQLYVSQHSSKLPYLKWLHAQLGRRFSMNPIKPKKGYEQYYFMTRPSVELGSLMQIFYPNGKKTIPREIMKLLNDPLSLAVWYMDDGTLDNRSRYHWNAMIASYGFGFAECELLAEALKRNFSLEVSVIRCQMRNVVYPRLYIRSSSMPKFISLIQPYIPQFSTISWVRVQIWPAAAVIRRVRALSGITGRKVRVGVLASRSLNLTAQP